MNIQVVFLKAETITAKAALCCFCYIHKQNTEPRLKQKKSLWSKQRGGFFSGSNRTVANRCYGNRFFDLQRSAGIKTTHTDGKGWHTTPWWPDHAATYSLLCTCLTESGVQIQSQHSRLRKVAKSKQGWNFQKKILIFNCFMRVNLYKTQCQNSSYLREMASKQGDWKQSIQVVSHILSNLTNTVY